MTEYIPTNAHSTALGYIRYRFAQGEYHDLRGWLTAEQQNEAYAIFDRWLEDVKRNAWARGYNEGYSTAEKRAQKISASDEQKLVQ